MYYTNIEEGKKFDFRTYEYGRNRLNYVDRRGSSGTIGHISAVNAIYPTALPFHTSGIYAMQYDGPMYLRFLHTSYYDYDAICS